ncbi:MAG TPA: hypothetical protein VJ890_26135 [Vineibacter sp.]|nr:hypothetical protein [Vineibacter sp.]
MPAIAGEMPGGAPAIGALDWSGRRGRVKSDIRASAASKVAAPIPTINAESAPMSSPLIASRQPPRGAGASFVVRRHAAWEWQLAGSATRIRPQPVGAGCG